MMQRAREGSTGVWAQGTGGVHLEDHLKVCDAGRVEAQRLVERLRSLPSRKGAYMVRGGRCRAVAAHASVHGKTRLESVSAGCTGGVHSEHLAHDCDEGRVEVQRLVERRCKLPKGGHTVFAARCRVPGGGRRRATAAARCVQALFKAGGQGTRGAHIEHEAHVRDLGRVEAERLVERRRFLPSRKAGMRCGARYGPGGVRALGVAATQAAYTGRARLGAVGVRARAERTKNMRYMFVTLDVLKLSGWLNAYACCRVERRASNVERGSIKR